MKKTILPLAVFAGLASALVAPGAHAIPAFARQTGQNCNACHVSFPELTPYGRYFKLSGYTLGKAITAYPEDVPLAVMAVVGVTDTKNNNLASGDKVDSANGKLKPQQLSLFLGGKATNHLGAFLQWTSEYNGSGYDFGADNMDIRLANTRVAPGGAQPDLIYGLTLNNNPTVQDVWNTVPAWWFPYMASSTGVNGLPASTQIGGFDPGNVAGLGAYAFWKNTIYAEFTAYRTADGMLSIFDMGNNSDTTAQPYFKGANPYWRFAYNKDWGPNSIEVGTFGMITDRYADGTNGGPYDRYKDYGLDSQFQHITGINTWTAQAAYIHEKAEWGATTGTSNSTDTLNTFRIKGSYWYRHKYGGTVGYFTSKGSTDTGHWTDPGATDFGGSQNGTPDTTGYVMELDYMPWDYVRLAAQYTAYTKFLGGSNYLDPNGDPRSASDNNSWFFYVWAAY